MLPIRMKIKMIEIMCARGGAPTALRRLIQLSAEAPELSLYSNSTHRADARPERRGGRLLSAVPQSPADGAHARVRAALLLDVSSAPALSAVSRLRSTQGQRCRNDDAQTEKQGSNVAPRP